MGWLLPSPLVGEGGESSSRVGGKNLNISASFLLFPKRRKGDQHGKRVCSHSAEKHDYAERFVWYRIRFCQIGGFRFRRQAPIGRYIADFVCFESKLVLELDGGQHATQVEADTIRTQWLEPVMNLCELKMPCFQRIGE